MKTTTGLGLTDDQAFRGLVDYGLFSDVIPPCFNSEGLSSHVPENLLRLLAEDDDTNLNNLLNNKRSHDFVRYESLRKHNIPRQMGIPHPESYTIQCLVLKRFWERIKRHCAKPEIPASRTFVQKTSEKRIFLMNYEGKQRFENEETDIRSRAGAQYMAQADISACFQSIYTHSIPWALHGKERGKKYRSHKIPGNLIDRVTRGTRDGQTNGLIVGPHASNVISEIILTRVDDSMMKKGYKNFTRYIDDYAFYAKTYQEAEDFIRQIGLTLREYDLTLNAEKTEILSLPRPIEKDWIRELKTFPFPTEGEISFESVRLFLDLALELAHKNETYAVLNYAIKMVPDQLDKRAKRLFTLEAVNLALKYPYLASLLQEHVFDNHAFNGITEVIRDSVKQLLDIGIQKLYPDAISYALYYSLAYDVQIRDIESLAGKIIEVDDCVADVLLLEYARRHRIDKIRRQVRRRADKLKSMEQREKDRFWLLIYQLWPEATLRGVGQTFLADLKHEDFAFVRL